VRNVTLLSSVPCSGNNIYTALKIRSEFHNVSVTVGVVDGLALHGAGAARKITAASTGSFDSGRSS